MPRGRQLRRAASNRQQPPLIITDHLIDTRVDRGKFSRFIRFLSNPNNFVLSFIVSLLYYMVVGAYIGSASAGVTIGVLHALAPPIVYLVNVGAMWLFSLLSTLLYVFVARFWWKYTVHNLPIGEDTYIKDQSLIRAGVGTAAACFTIVTVIATHPDTPSWLEHWWTLVLGTAAIGALSIVSIVFITPTFLYRIIYHRFPESGQTGLSDPGGNRRERRRQAKQNEKQ